jgi:hypothetical protein
VQLKHQLDLAARYLEGGSDLRRSLAPAMQAQDLATPVQIDRPTFRYPASRSGTGSFAFLQPATHFSDFAR